MHSFTTERSKIASNTIRRTSSMHPIKSHGTDTTRHRQSSIRDVYLPPIHKQVVPTPMANLELAKTWSNSTKELIAQEWENLQKIKNRGTLAPKYNVLPPINQNKNSLFNNNNNNTTMFSVKNGVDANTMFGASQLQRIISAKDADDEASQQHNHKDLPRMKRNSKRRKYKNIQQHQPVDPTQPNATATTTATASTTKKAEKHQKNISSSSEKLVQFPQLNNEESQKCGTTDKEESSTKATPARKLPIFPSPSKTRSKNYEQLEKKYNDEMMGWARHAGRRCAICYEMDPLFHELTSIIKYNLLVQHLEDIWMC